MVFTSVEFMFLLLPLTIILYLIAANIRVKNLVLLSMSIVFYSWGEPRTVFLVIISTIVNWLFGLAFAHGGAKSGAKTKIAPNSKELPSGKRMRNRIILIAAVVYNIGLLGIFKYFNFTLDNLNRILSIFSASVIQYTPILLPIGISFYIFQILSYVIDVYRGDAEVQKNPFDLGLYITMFPQLVAGPIVRYTTIAKEMKNRHTSIQDFKNGVCRFMIGFCKKLLISNNVAVLANIAFETENPPFLLAWLGIIAYTLQLYFDFSAYSDMAIGMGEMFGFHFLENFNYPYISGSIKEFWRRWHISLSSWFRDYLYIPLGGNRKGKGRTYINLIIVFFITGLWHGASWNFVVWGLFHGVFLILERSPFGVWMEKRNVLLRHLYTLLVVIVGWVFFRAENLPAAFAYLGRMFSNPAADAQFALSFLNREMIFFFVAGILFTMPVYPLLKKKIDTLGKKSLTAGSLAITGTHDLIVFACFVIAALYMIGSDFSPFIYYRF